jgi:serine phosphatase RsbU (regulator of sigma subunit)
MASSGSMNSSDFKALYGKIERALDQFEQIEDSTRLLEVVMQNLVRDFRGDLGFEMGRLYRREGEDFFLCGTSGGTRPVPLGFKVPRDYPPHVKTLENGLLIMGRGDPGYDEQFEWAVGVTTTFAAISVGPGATHVLAFSVSGDIREEDILYSLSAVRHVINLKLQERRLAGIIDEARIIQESLLPKSDPESSVCQIHGESRSAEVVGGDFFDYMGLSEGVLGVAIGDASGHGLPAALLARDAVTGLRMGIECGAGVVPAVERLNRVIHHAELSSNFISLFYGVFQQDGTVSYCNAGHNPPLLLSNGKLSLLREGGLVLGPDPSARYRQGRVLMQAGDLLVLYTDGIIEAENPEGEQFGMDRLRHVIHASGKASAPDVVADVFRASEGFAQGCRQRDDMTVVAVRLK